MCRDGCAYETQKSKDAQTKLLTSFEAYETYKRYFN